MATIEIKTRTTITRAIPGPVADAIWKSQVKAHDEMVGAAKVAAELEGRTVTVRGPELQNVGGHSKLHSYLDLEP